MMWQPIETAPKCTMETMDLQVWRWGPGRKVELVRTDGDFWAWEAKQPWGFPFTHWHPLEIPEPPK
jgi:hypothetical protein